ncbi:hypothetical protein NWE48_11985 [Escherichia coli]|nr:hypothetical protein [Escherichia coli]
MSSVMAVNVTVSAISKHDERSSSRLRCTHCGHSELEVYNLRGMANASQYY